MPTTVRTTPRSRVFHPLPPVAFVARYPVRVMDRAPARVDRSVVGVSGAVLNAAVLTAVALVAVRAKAAVCIWLATVSHRTGQSGSSCAYASRGTALSRLRLTTLVAQRFGGSDCRRPCLRFR